MQHTRLRHCQDGTAKAPGPQRELNILDSKVAHGSEATELPQCIAPKRKTASRGHAGVHRRRMLCDPLVGKKVVDQSGAASPIVWPLRTRDCRNGDRVGAIKNLADKGL